MIGGEGGIRTFGVSLYFNRLRRHRVQIVSNVPRSLAAAIHHHRRASRLSPRGTCVASTRPRGEIHDGLRTWRFLVYRWCMSRTNVDIDDKACATVMRRYRLATKRDAINFALRTLAAEPLGLDEARKLRGSGWIGDLDEMRVHRKS